MLQTNRSLLKLILLSFITFGIYGLVFWYKLIKDVNVICVEDGKKTSGIIALFFLTLITFGIYSFWWYYNVGERLHDAGQRYNITVDVDGGKVLIWILVGLFTVGIGQLVAIHLMIKNLNILSEVHNSIS
ncbi:MAG TPA: DUF4234 domain-containing protein [Clostridia bacterium]|nr:DUF4234 domain-containing protein [Clostridia bacterium]